MAPASLPEKLSSAFLRENWVILLNYSIFLRFGLKSLWWGQTAKVESFLAFNRPLWKIHGFWALWPKNTGFSIRFSGFLGLLAEKTQESGEKRPLKKYVKKPLGFFMMTFFIESFSLLFSLGIRPRGPLSLWTKAGRENKGVSFKMLTWFPWFPPEINEKSRGS